ncbi:MAG: DUF2064 domain-containing protein [Leptospiraceae bacterium]|nr:DUF2064 domain-containing protein [Leptospiraceae bacterium]
MKIAFAFFVKTPGKSPIKTRLSKTIGKEKAEKIFIEFIKNIEELKEKVLMINNEIDFYWAVGENEELNNPLWTSFPTIWTGNGGLGARMQKVYNELLENYKIVFLCGSDSPGFEPSIFLKAIQKLKSNEIKLIFIPANDGGFCAIGGKEKLSENVWLDTEYSNNDTLKNFIKNISLPENQIYFLPELIDVDTIEDLNLVVKNLNGKLKDNIKKILEE